MFKAELTKVVFSSHRQDWLLLEGNFESVESMLALNMYSPNAVYACKTYMLVKMGVPAACCFAITFSALSLTHVHADCALKCKQQYHRQSR